MFYQKRIYLYFAPRSRMCDNPYKCGDGLECIGESSEIKTVNGGWSEWSEWSENDGSLSRYVMKCMCKGKVKNSINCENFPKADIF